MLKKLGVSKEIRSQIGEQIPRSLIKQRKGSHNTTLDYISGSTVIDILNNVFGHNWNWRVLRAWREDSDPYFDRNDKFREKPFPQGGIVHCLGRLTVCIQDEDGTPCTISKDGFGSKMIVGGQADQKDNYKAAATDALKKAASLLGVGAQLYRDDDEQAFFESLEAEDPWADDAVYEAHAEEREYIKNLMDIYDISLGEMDGFVSEWSNGKIKVINDLLPDDMTEFVEHLRESSKEWEKEEA